MHQEEGLDFSRVAAFTLDEYVGLERSHPCSYHSVMSKNFFTHVNIQPENVHIPDGATPDIQQECQRYEAEIAAVGGIDLQILGLGEDGHIGFNEPSSSLASRTRLKALTEKTRYDNSRFFPTFTEVPRHVITMGVGTIMEAKKIILLAFGQRKSRIISRVVEGPITAMVPGSVLQYHSRVKVIIDEPAAEQLQLKSYFKWVYENKPTWQGL